MIGLSGGIDSSVVAVICKSACPTNILGVILPCESDPQDKTDAISVAQEPPNISIILRMYRYLRSSGKPSLRKIRRSLPML